MPRAGNGSGIFRCRSQYKINLWTGLQPMEWHSSFLAHLLFIKTQCDSTGYSLLLSSYYYDNYWLYTAAGWSRQHSMTWVTKSDVVTFVLVGRPSGVERGVVFSMFVWYISNSEGATNLFWINQMQYVRLSSKERISKLIRGYKVCRIAFVR